MANNRSGSVAFKPRARLLKLIGAELISNEVVALTELVKNSHDADASKVTVEFLETEDPEEGQIIVRDDGCGMDLETLLTCWMEPAGSLKGKKELHRTPRGRRVLGEKGVGRFAADKLGHKLELVSRKADSPLEVRACFDWEEFECEKSLLSEIHNEWEERSPEEIDTHGTILRISGLRSRWTERMFRRLCNRLSRLKSPFGDYDSFEIEIESDEFPEYSGSVNLGLLDVAPYAIEAAFDGIETITTTLPKGKPVDHLWNGTGELTCGPVRLRLFGFDLETEALARLGPRTEVRAWLKEWSGISIYRDGFRIWPYGEPHDDWLRLDQRRVNNPTVRLSNNQVVGFVEIGRDSNPELVDQTNRQGLIQNRAMDDLRRLMFFVLQILEAERQAIRRPAKRRGKESNSGKAGPNGADPVRVLESLTDQLEDEKIGDKLSKATSLVRKELAREREHTRLLEEGYSDLAALGQAAAGLTLMTNPVLQNLQTELAALRSSMHWKANEKASSRLAGLEESVQLLTQQLALLSSVDENTSTRQRRRTIDIGAELERAMQLFLPLLRRVNAVLEVEWPDHTPLRTEMRPEIFHRLLHILFSNSVDWLHGVGAPIIRVKATDKGKDLCELLVSDNGPGIPHEYAEKVFSPMFTGKEGGQGMGLTIAKNLVTAHGGELSVITDRRRKGANLLIKLKRKKARSTARKA